MWLVGTWCVGIGSVDVSGLQGEEESAPIGGVFEAESEGFRDFLGACDDKAVNHLHSRNAKNAWKRFNFLTTIGTLSDHGPLSPFSVHSAPSTDLLSSKAYGRKG